MEIRVLRYFVEMAREGSMTRAAERLHITQPTMSKQLHELEDELGQKLFTRSNYSVRLTDAGLLLLRRAQDILDMADKTQAEFRAYDAGMGGVVSVGSPESDSFKYFARAVKRVQSRCPRIRFDVLSGDSVHVTDRLDRGLLDFAAVMDRVDENKYNFLELPAFDSWGLFMRLDSPLAKKKHLTLDDLFGVPLIVSSQCLAQDFPRWFGDRLERLNIVATYNLFYNGAVMVREGLGCAVSYDKLAHTGSGSGLCYREIEGLNRSRMFIIWKKHQLFSPAAEMLLEELKSEFGKTASQENE